MEKTKQKRKERIGKPRKKWRKKKERKEKKETIEVLHLSWLSSDKHGETSFHERVSGETRFSEPKVWDQRRVPTVYSLRSPLHLRNQWRHWSHSVNRYALVHILTPQRKKRTRERSKGKHFEGSREAFMNKKF